jgi:hypothetical protein
MDMALLGHRSNLHVHAGLHEIFSKQLSPRIELVLKGIKRENAKIRPPPTRLPITIDIMGKIRGPAPTSSGV